MTDDTRTGGGAGAGTAAYRGFLFSDMRGFTAFAERHGNAAAAAMVGRFLDLARTAIARHEGAEIKTEGDAIHAVFPSASSAVMCGLEIVDAAAELNAQEPDRPLGLGVGVHAGEAVETAEGYIGRAVNIAARLCASAKPGEVLVSSTVKGITQSSIPVGFIPRGSRRLKGIQDPIVVYSVTRDMSARGPREVPRPVLLGGAAAAVVALVTIAAVAGSMLFPGASKDPGESAPPSQVAVTELPAAPAVGRLDLGTYRTRLLEPTITFEIGDRGWSADNDLKEIFGLVREDDPQGSLYVMRVQEVIPNACVAEGVGAAQPPSPLTLLIQVENLRHVTVSERVPVEIGGYAGRMIEVTVGQDAQAICGGLANAEVSMFVAGDEIWGAATQETFRLISLDVDGQAVAVVISYNNAHAPVPEWEALLRLSQRVLDSLRFS